MMGSKFDALERFYTPPNLAAACLDTAPSFQRPPVVLEPSVGGGAFVRAARDRWPGCVVVGVDVDPGAEGLQICDYSVRADILSLDPADIRAGLARLTKKHRASGVISVGNWPFSVAGAHLAALRRIVDGPVCAILPLSRLESTAKGRELTELDPPGQVTRVARRPWPKHCRAAGWWVWSGKPSPRRAIRIPAKPIVW